jgi:hypothetical protein
MHIAVHANAPDQPFFTQHARPGNYSRVVL